MDEVKGRNIFIYALDMLPLIISTGVFEFSVVLQIEPGESVTG